MLRPSKHSHPDQTVVNTALVLLVRLRGRRLEEFDALRGHVKKAIKGGDALYLPALNLLYLLGLVAYRPKTDSVEYVGSK
jgi:hypothetical protein